ncbi:BT1 family protein [Leishmania donovani]|uniref:BT1 family protein n=1 Tax=Leishmania donovani TaxID=5661 RepID=A0A504Y5R1_LEIDO|nr:BT1 family protein [Leishmania donovani]
MPAAVTVHPLVLLSIVDHVTRVGLQPQQQRPPQKQGSAPDAATASRPAPAFLSTAGGTTKVGPRQACQHTCGAEGRGITHHPPSSLPLRLQSTDGVAVAVAPSGDAAFLQNVLRDKTDWPAAQKHREQLSAVMPEMDVVGCYVVCAGSRWTSTRHQSGGDDRDGSRLSVGGAVKKAKGEAMAGADSIAAIANCVQQQLRNTSILPSTATGFVLLVVYDKEVTSAAGDTDTAAPNPPHSPAAARLPFDCLYVPATTDSDALPTEEVTVGPADMEWIALANEAMMPAYHQNSATTSSAANCRAAEELVGSLRLIMRMLVEMTASTPSPTATAPDDVELLRTVATCLRNVPVSRPSQPPGGPRVPSALPAEEVLSAVLALELNSLSPATMAEFHGSAGREKDGGDGAAEVGSLCSGVPGPMVSGEQKPPITQGSHRTKADGAIVHPQAESLFAACPWVRLVPVIGDALEGYGPRLIASVCLAYFLCKGVADQMIGFSRQPMLMRRYGLDATRYQRLAAVWGAGWSVKAFIAALTDTFAFMGYTKRWYMLLSCVMGAGFSLGYALLPAQPSSGAPAAVFIFLTTLGKSSVDILSEGHYSRLMRRNPRPGPALVSCVWLSIFTGALIASVMQGPLSESGKVHVGVMISAALQFVAGILFVFNWYGEKTNRAERLQDLRDAKAALAKASALGEDLHLEGQNSSPPPQTLGKHTHQLQRSFLALDDDMLDLSTCDGVKGTHEQQRVSALRSDVVAAEESDNDETVGEDLRIPSCLFGVFEINTEVVQYNWRAVLYSTVMTCSVVTLVCVTILAQVFFYLNSLLYLQLPGALDSFYLADASCVPGGPHFSYVFYNTISAVISNIGGVVGIVLFTNIFSKMSYQVTMCITVSLMAVASIFDIIMVERWNVYMGIPDHAMYLCGDAIIYNICSMLSTMPCTILMSRLCPRGSESMVYALMSGLSNFGQTVSTAVGSLLMETRWPLQRALARGHGHLCCPLLIVPLSFLLLPRSRICDDIDVNGHAIHAPLRAELVRVGLSEQRISTDKDCFNSNANAPDAHLTDARASDPHQLTDVNGAVRRVVK